MVAKDKVAGFNSPAVAGFSHPQPVCLFPVAITLLIVRAERIDPRRKERRRQRLWHLILIDHQSFFRIRGRASKSWNLTTDKRASIRYVIGTEAEGGKRW